MVCKLSCFLLFFVVHFSLATAQDTGTFTDARDHRIYKTVKIGSQIWMAENLKFKPESGGGYCTFDNKEIKLERFGYLYNFPTALKSCPSGWKIPTSAQFETLLQNLSGADAYSALIKGGSSQFNCELGGYRDADKAFVYNRDDGIYWCSNYNSNGYQMTFWIGGAKRSAGFYFDMFSCLMLSVRCIKEN